MNTNIRALLMTCALSIVSVPAYAYIDPGTGSALIGALVAVFAGIVATVKLYWHRLIGLFSRDKPNDGAESERHGDDKLETPDGGQAP